MKNAFLAAVIAGNQQELDERFAKLSEIKSLTDVHLDVMDGHFVKQKSLLFDFILPKKYQYEAHLMCNERNAKIWLRSHLEKFSSQDTIILHYESAQNITPLIAEVKSQGVRVGVALNPRTGSDQVIPHLNSLDSVLILTVNPGKYGAKYLPKNLNKVKKLRKLTHIDLEVDGSVNDATILKMVNSGANRFVMGSYLQNAENANKAFTAIKNIVKARKVVFER